MRTDVCTKKEQPAVAVRADRQEHDGHVPRIAVHVGKQMSDVEEPVVVDSRTARRVRPANRSSGRAASTSVLYNVVALQAEEGQGQRKWTVEIARNVISRRTLPVPGVVH